MRISNTIHEFRGHRIGWFRIGCGIKWNHLPTHGQLVTIPYGCGKYIIIGKWIIAYLPKNI